MLSAPTTATEERGRAQRSPAAPEYQHSSDSPSRGDARAQSSSLRVRSSARGNQDWASLQRSLGNQAALRVLSQPVHALQTKLTINRPGDHYEQEAERVAEQVMRMPAPAFAPNLQLTSGRGALQRACTCGGSGSECESCKEEREEGMLQTMAAGPSALAEAPPIVHEVLRSPGQPLDRATRSFFEPRFGQDFSGVRLHTGTQAARSAEAVSALAYTVGNDIVFRSGSHLSTRDGQRTLAHELTHVLQQRPFSSPVSNPELDSDVDPSLNDSDPISSGVARKMSHTSQSLAQGHASLQRACGPDDIGAPSDCVGVSGDIPGEHFLFVVACDDFRHPPDVIGDEEGRLRSFAGTITSGDTLEIHGFASEEGDKTFNENLSCARAIKAQSVLNSEFLAAGKQVTISQLFKHGATAGNREERRSVFIDKNSAPPPPPSPSCLPPSSCPADFCSPMSRTLALADRAFRAQFILSGIGAAVDPRVIPVWTLYIGGGTAKTVDLSTIFAADFTSEKVTVDVTNFLLDAIADDLRASPPVFPPGGASIVRTVDASFGPSTAKAIAEIRTPGAPHSMEFSGTTVPGNLAGGIGTNEAACPAGAIPSTIDDDRLVAGTVTISTDPATGEWVVDPDIVYTVIDTVDFCPGNCGSGLALVATVPLSRWEASGISGDVPFTVKFPAPKPARFTVVPPASGP